MTGESSRLCGITHNLRQMELRGTKEYGQIFKKPQLVCEFNKSGGLNLVDLTAMIRQ